MTLSHLSPWTSLAGLAALAACAGPVGSTGFEPTIERQVACMGTSLHVMVQAELRSDALALSEQIVRTLSAAEQRLSTWTESGPLARHNAGSQEQLPEELRLEMDAAMHWERATQGAFQPRSAALIEAWDLRGSGRIPSLVERQDAAADHSRWEEGAWGKGAGLDAVSAQLELSPTQAVQVNLGGQWLLLGPGEFELAVAHPLDRQRGYLSLSVPAGSLATTGNSERAIQVGSERIGHILDPRTGDSVDARGSVSVWHQSALAADCVATALFVLGPQAAMQWAQQHPDFEVLFLEVRPNDEIIVHASSKWHEQLNLHSSS